MTDQEINRAIAEACGWKRCEPCAKNGYFRWRTPEDNGCRVDLPDYCNDLNAMHEAEETMKTGEPHRFVFALMEMLGAFAPSLGDDYQLIHATARQRAEAFLRAIGKWS